MTSDQKIWLKPEVHVLDATSTASGPTFNPEERFITTTDGNGNVIDQEPLDGPTPS